MLVVFGSINLDISFSLEHMPAAGETVLGSGCLLSPGGKGANQAHAAKLCGAEVAMVGMVGDDPFAEPALERLRAAGVDLSGVGVSSDRMTGCASIFLDQQGENAIAVALGANQDVRAAQVADERLTADTVLLLQQETPLAENHALVERARDRGCRIILNAAPGFAVPLEILSALNYLIVNEVELRQVSTFLNLDTGGTETELAQRLSETAGTAVIATQGAQGVTLADAGDNIHIPAFPVEPMDTTAAGDTFAGAFGASLGRGYSESEALRFAAAAAALCCLGKGAQQSQPTVAEINRLLESSGPNT